MKSKRLLDALVDINEDYIVQAAPKHQKRNLNILIKWGALAACFVFIFVTIIPAALYFGSSKDYVEPIRIIEYENAVYEIIEPDHRSTLRRYHLPQKITSDMIGEFITAAKTDSAEDVKLYQYNAGIENEQKAVVIVKEGNESKFALFCNFTYNSVVSAQELFAVYGVREAADIKSVTLKERHHFKKVLREKEEIEHFYDTLTDSTFVNEEQYQKKVFQRKPEEEQQEMCTRLAEESIEIRIEMTDGLVTEGLSYYPSVQFVNWSLGHYKVKEAPFR